jgi:hypothetical protein
MEGNRTVEELLMEIQDMVGCTAGKLKLVHNIGFRWEPPMSSSLESLQLPMKSRLRLVCPRGTHSEASAAVVGQKSKNAKMANLHSIFRIFAYLGQKVRSPKMLKWPTFIAYPGCFPTLAKR